MAIRAIRNKKRQYNLADLLILSMGLIGAIAMFMSLNLILCVFAFIALWICLRYSISLYKYRFSEKIPLKNLMNAHTASMKGTYISAFTAFMVNMQIFESAWYNWVSPLLLFLLFAYIERGDTDRKINIQNS
jgi:hypothetical protein